MRTEIKQNDDKEKIIFVRYEKYKRETNMMATILKYHAINLSVATMGKCVKDKKYAELYYSEEKKQIGLKLQDKKSINSYHITKQKNRIGRITARAFMEHYRILPQKPIKCEVFYVEHENLLVIDIPKERKPHGNE